MYNISRTMERAMGDKTNYQIMSQRWVRLSQRTWKRDQPHEG
ncbi:MAG: hypothetical protein AB1714_02790 [Acidobacteriota bacterium]